MRFLVFAVFSIALSLLNVSGANDLPPLKILQLGDSYASGNGARSESGHRNYVGPQNCRRSPTGWGAQYADSLRGSYSVTYICRACSDSLLEHLIEPRLMEEKKGRCPDREKWFEDEYYDQTSWRRCSRYVAPQIESVDNTTDMVLIGIGGNDADFPTLIIDCLLLSPSPGDAKRCQKALDEGYKAGPLMTERLNSFFLDIWSRMGKSGRIVLFFYPYIVSDIPKILKDHGGVEVDGAAGIRDLVDFGNAALDKAREDTNAALGIEFVTTFNMTPAVFAGHEPDPRLLHRSKDGWITEFNSVKIGEMFHLNSRGHLEYATAVAKEGTFGFSPSPTMEQRRVTNRVTAWAGDAYSGKIGEEIVFDATGSFDADGLELISYEWDFDNDGLFDATSIDSTNMSQIYEREYFGKVTLRVTNEHGHQATDQAMVDINEEGYTYTR